MNKKTEWKIYCHTNLKTGKKYIGQTRLSLEKRWGKEGRGYKKQEYFYGIITYYGWENFSHEVLEVAYSQEEADDREKYYIKKFDSITHGYNRAEGGIKETQFSSKKVICNGKTYNSEKDFADDYNLNYVTVSGWLTKRNSMPQNFIDLGLRYYGDSNTTYTAPLTDYRRKVVCEGVVYDSISICAEHYNVKERTLRAYLDKQINMHPKFIKMNLHYYGEENTVYNQSKSQLRKIICENKTYDSIAKCAKEYEISGTMLQYYLKGKYKMPQIWIDRGLRYAD